MAVSPVNRPVMSSSGVGSPLLQHLVRFLQRSYPGVRVDPSKVDESKVPGLARGVFDLPGRGGGLVRMGRLLDALGAAGGVQIRGGVGPDWKRVAYWNPSQPAVPVPGAVPQVPLATLPGGPGGVQPAPIAQTPAGPMLYPPGPPPMGAVDPEPPRGTAAWFAWRYGPSTAQQRLAQMRSNLAR